METYRMNGIYGEGDVYVLKTMEDWDELEKISREKDPEFPKWNPAFFPIKNDFQKYMGKIWQEKDTRYRVIGIEDNNPMADWYWIVQNVNDDRDIKHILANSKDLKNGIIL